MLKGQKNLAGKKFGGKKFGGKKFGGKKLQILFFVTCQRN
jgi:hypothetical protein